MYHSSHTPYTIAGTHSKAGRIAAETISSKRKFHKTIFYKECAHVSTCFPSRSFGLFLALYCTHIYIFKLYQHSNSHSVDFHPIHLQYTLTHTTSKATRKPAVSTKIIAAKYLSTSKLTRSILTFGFISLNVQTYAQSAKAITSNFFLLWVRASTGVGLWDPKRTREPTTRKKHVFIPMGFG